MKMIFITEEEVSITVGKRKYAYPIVRGKLAVSLEEANGMPDEVRITFLVLSAAKALPIGPHYNDIREPVWKCYHKTSGLSDEGHERFGKVEAVVEAVDLLQKRLTIEQGQQPSITSEIERQKEAEIQSSQNAGGGEQESSGPLPEALSITPRSDPWKDGEPFLMHVQMVDVDFFYPNPLSLKLYGDTINFGVQDSVAERGVLVPIRALRDGRLIDGSQRVGGAKLGNWKKAPTIFLDVPEGQELELILQYNQQRIKTTKELLREFRAHLEIEKKKATKRAGTRTDRERHLPEGHSQWGKSRDLAAKKIGLSGSSAERGLRVLEEIEKRGSNGVTDTVDQKLIEIGINAAWTYASSLGWFDKAIKPKDSKPKETRPPQKQNDDTEPDGDSEVREESREVDTESMPLKPVEGWMTDELIDGLISSVEMKDHNADLRRTLSFLRPRIYEVYGITPEKSKASKMCLLAKAITSLANRYKLFSK